MKKLIPIFVALLAFTVFAGFVISTPNTVLYFLNWGEYIDMTLVSKFEQEFNCQVVLETVTSSEAMYQKITSGTTSYDVAVPGDYTVHQLYNEGYLRKFDTSNAEYPNLQKYDSLFVDSLSNLMSQYMVDEKTGEEFNDYFFPYFYGAYSIVYSTEKSDVENVIENNGFSALFDRSLYNEDVKIGMYDTARWIVSVSLMAESKDPNITNMEGTSKDGDMDNALKNHLIDKLRSAKFNEFGNDSMKRNVANGSLDMCYTQLGDFFDALYLAYDESSERPVKFNVAVPKLTSAFFDSMVIPTTCQNYSLANAFVNFMMDGDNAYQNATAIGYSPTLKSVIEKYHEAAEAGDYYFGDADTSGSLLLKDFLTQYPVYLDPLGDVETAYLLEPKSTQYLSTCEAIFNSLA